VSGSISPNLKRVVYMGGVKYGGDDEWQFIWKRFERTQTPSEKSKLLSALSTSTDVLILNRYLASSVFHSMLTTFLLAQAFSTNQSVGSLHPAFLH